MLNYKSIKHICKELKPKVVGDLLEILNQLPFDESALSVRLIDKIYYRNDKDVFIYKVSLPCGSKFEIEYSIYYCQYCNVHTINVKDKHLIVEPIL